ncbi:hypothetical protein OV208_20220 [Corallococcus sp. bb12-1]|uniref:hypothetical protein n=1 Tax=Corallococcus sp. bb12-1 TaxID=2996784 RepID=UPI00227228F5|nr:hypothetical protein [Corallococcus sp. bb12-1]MCY1043656.1 hypothetical protein [Corallococcus sp. bb12-1]
MPVTKHPLSVFLLCACLFGLGACDSTSNPTPDAGAVVDAGPDAGPVVEPEPTCDGFSCSEGTCSIQDGQPVCRCGDGSAPPCPAPEIPDGYTLVTPSETEVHSVPWGNMEVPLRFAFVAQAGRHYDFIVEVETEGYVLNLRDAAGVSLDYGVMEDGVPSWMPYTWHWSGFAANAVYTLEISAYSHDGRRPFAFRFVDTGPDDQADLFAFAAPWVPSAQPLTGISEHYYERDLLSFQTVAARVYAFTCTFPTPYWEMAFVNRRDQEYAIAAYDIFFEEIREGSIAFKSPGGMFYASIKDFTYPTTLAPYSCLLNDLGAEDHGDTMETATALPAGTASVQGKMETFMDRDVFSLRVVPQHHYRASCTEDGLMSCEILDAVPGGAFTRSTSERTTTTFKALQSTHYVSINLNAFLVSRWVRQNYALQFEDLGEDDHGDTLATATPLTGPVQAITGRIPDSYDHDFFSFQAIAGRRYRFGCDWKETPGQVQLYAVVRDAQDNRVEVPREHVDARWTQTYTQLQTGTYSVDLMAESEVALGDYACQFEDLGP